MDQQTGLGQSGFLIRLLGIHMTLKRLRFATYWLMRFIGL